MPGHATVACRLLFRAMIRCPLPPLLAAGLLMLLTATLGSPCLRAEESYDVQVAKATLVKAGQPAPDFTCHITDGRSFTLSAKKGKVVVLVFFATSVGSYGRQLQQLEQEIVQKVRGRDDWDLLALGRGHSREELVQIGGQNRLTLPLAADPDAAVFGRYFSKFVPRIVVVGRDGVIASILNGYQEITGVVQLQQILARELARPR